jgi:ketosteroid isomerase-like protein
VVEAVTAQAAKQSPDSEEAVREVNRRFYQAFAALDLAQMEEVWLREDWVECVHPGWNILRGWEEIRESWAGIFQGARRMKVEISNVSLNVEGTVAWVACTERITSTFDTGFDQVRAQATNIFVQRKVPDAPGGEPHPRWFMIAHHASPIAPTAPPPLQ